MKLCLFSDYSPDVVNVVKSHRTRHLKEVIELRSQRSLKKRDLLRSDDTNLIKISYFIILAAIED